MSAAALPGNLRKLFECTDSTSGVEVRKVFFLVSIIHRPPIKRPINAAGCK